APTTVSGSRHRVHSAPGRGLRFPRRARAGVLVLHAASLFAAPRDELGLLQGVEDAVQMVGNLRQIQLADELRRTARVRRVAQPDKEGQTQDVEIEAVL